MIWTDATRLAAIAEIRDDPESRGYAAMTDSEVAADMALEIWQTPPATISVPASTIIETLESDEQTAWRTSEDDDATTAWDILFALLSSGGSIKGDRLLDYVLAFGPDGQAVFGTTTAAALSALVPTVSRWRLLGFPEMTSGWVAWLREAING